MIKKINNNKSVISIILALFFIFSQVFVFSGVSVKADSNFSVKVVVEGNAGIIASGTSQNSNAYNALKDVLGSKTLDISNHFINKIDTLSNDTTNWTKYWMMAIDRNNAYADVNDGIDQLVLNSGDELIVYYAAPSTVTANDVTFSTNAPNKPLTISLNNLSKDWSTSKDIVTPISNVSVKLDGKAATLTNNQIQLNSGLASGKHSLEISDYSESGIPKVVADTLTFNIAEPTCTVRVEGITDTIKTDTATGANVLEIFKNALDDTSNGKSKIPYAIQSGQYGSYIESINGITAGKYGQYSGWCYYVKNADKIISPSASMDAYIPEEGDNIIVYYSDGTVPFVNEITFSPAIVKANENFAMNFAYNYVDYTTNKNIKQPIKNAKVTIDSSNYTTDDNGQVIVSGLANGAHTYKINGYNSDALSSVVMDNGTFTIDGVNSPSFNGSTTQYDSGQDNSKVVKNIPAEISATADVVKTYNDAWSSVDLYNLGLAKNINTNFLLEEAVNIKSFGVSSLSNTELEKLIIGLSACGYSPYNFDGQDIVSELYNRNINNFMTTNDLDYALIAYNYTNISDKSYKITKNVLVDKLLAKVVTSNSLTGWNYSGKNIDSDLTGITINALSGFYKTDAKVASAINSAIKSLASLQNINGYVPGQNGIASETNAFIILGLTAVGVDPEGVTTLSDGSNVSFSKLNGDLVSSLLSFKADKGQFKHLLADTAGNAISTEEALRALIAVNNFRNSKLYNYYGSNIDASKLSVYDYSKANNAKITKDIAAAITNNEKTVSISNTAADDYSIKISIPVSAMNTAATAANKVEGFTVSNDDSTIYVPSDIVDIGEYLSGNYSLAVSKTDATEENSNTALSFLPKGLNLVGTVFDLNMSINNDDNGNKVLDIHNFNGDSKVKLTIKLSDTTGVDTSKLVAYYFNTNTNNWEYIGGNYDKASNSFTFETTHFSRFALLQGTISSNSDSTNNSSSQNTNVTALPQTGAFIIDDKFLYALGSLMIIGGAAVILIYRKRKC